MCFKVDLGEACRTRECALHMKLGQASTCERPHRFGHIVGRRPPLCGTEFENCSSHLRRQAPGVETKCVCDALLEVSRSVAGGYRKREARGDDLSYLCYCDRVHALCYQSACELRLFSRSKTLGLHAHSRPTLSSGRSLRSTAVQLRRRARREASQAQRTRRRGRRLTGWDKACLSPHQ